MLRRLRGVLLSFAFLVSATLCSTQGYAQQPAVPAPPVPVAVAVNCEPGWIARVYRDTRASVVRIENVDGLGTGFVFYTPRYVATAFHVISIGREITVTSADGARQQATVALVDPAHDLAILLLEHPI